MNVQVISSPDGTIRWTSGALPGKAHDLSAAWISVAGAVAADAGGRLDNVSGQRAEGSRHEDPGHRGKDQGLRHQVRKPRRTPESAPPAPGRRWRRPQRPSSSPIRHRCPWPAPCGRMRWKLTSPSMTIAHLIRFRRSGAFPALPLRAQPLLSSRRIHVGEPVDDAVGERRRRGDRLEEGDPLAGHHQHQVGEVRVRTGPGVGDGQDARTDSMRQLRRRQQ